MVYIALILLGIYLLIALLTKFGPKASLKKFWITFFRIRTKSEKIFPILFICLLVVAVAVFAVSIAINGSAGTGNSSLSSNAVVTAILCICYFCLKDLGKSAKNGEACECCGDCSKCRIQCTSNEKYYGLNQGKDKK